MILRKYQSEDCAELIRLFYDTVHNVNAKDYSPEQLSVWAPGNLDIAEWNKLFLAHNTIIAEVNSIIIGFGDMDNSGYLDRLYVHKDYQNQGIATVIVNQLEQEAKQNGVMAFTTHASTTAKSFFEKRGYIMVRSNQVIRDGIALTNYLMRKNRGINMENKIIPLTITMPFGEIQNTVHPTLLLDNENIILVDCGFSGALPLLEKELESHGLCVQQLTGLVLTHHDHDHMGAAAALKRLNPNIIIYSSSDESVCISAAEKPLRLSQAEEMQKQLPPEMQDFGKAFTEMLRRVEPVAVDYLVEDEEIFPWCGGCRVIATPGHTPGHISLFLQKESIVITGDAFALEEDKPVIANPQFTLDMAQATDSMEKLLSIDADAYYCYHGGIYKPSTKQ